VTGFIKTYQSRLPEEISGRLHFLMRLGILGCFVGHGAWGLIGKDGWLPFFEVYGIGENTARMFMPIIGIMDIAVGIICFFYPTRFLLLYGFLWAFFTATLRPSANMGMSEFYERAGNYGVPLAMLVMSGMMVPWKKWFAKITIEDMSFGSRLPAFEMILRLSLVLLLAGHGGLALFNQHAVIAKHLGYLGIDPVFSNMAILGVFEVVLALAVLFFPSTYGLIIFAFIFKIATELLHPLAGRPIDLFETIERFGDYVIPLSLIVIHSWVAKTSSMKADLVS
jgi:hypothetical protein